MKREFSLIISSPFVYFRGGGGTRVLELQITSTAQINVARRNRWFHSRATLTLNLSLPIKLIVFKFLHIFKRYQTFPKVYVRYIL